MSTTLTTRRAARLIAPDALQGPPTMEAHLRRYGPLPLGDGSRAGASDRLLAEVERSGLTGRGGAGFPTARKLASARATDRPTLIVNAMEGEPASAKDHLLVGTAPHLVLDGAEVVAGALGAQRTFLCVADSAPEMAGSLARAQAERTGRSRGGELEVRQFPGRYVAGEESALASAVGGGRGVPRFRPDKSVPLSVARQPVLVHNAETLAHVALIARYGADWFREVGAPEAPGTCLVTVSGGVECPGVVEVATGTPVSEIIGRARLSGPLRPCWWEATAARGWRVRTSGCPSPRSACAGWGRPWAPASLSCSPPVCVGSKRRRASPASWPPRAPGNAARACSGCRLSPMTSPRSPPGRGAKWCSTGYGCDVVRWPVVAPAVTPTAWCASYAARWKSFRPTWLVTSTVTRAPAGRSQVR